MYGPSQEATARRFQLAGALSQSRPQAWNVKSAPRPASVVAFRFLNVSASPSAAVIKTSPPELLAAVVNALKSANSAVGSEIVSWSAPLS